MFSYLISYPSYPASPKALPLVLWSALKLELQLGQQSA